MMLVIPLIPDIHIRHHVVLYSNLLYCIILISLISCKFTLLCLTRCFYPCFFSGSSFLPPDCHFSSGISGNIFILNLIPENSFEFHKLSSAMMVLKYQKVLSFRNFKSRVLLLFFMGFSKYDLEFIFL